MSPLSRGLRAWLSPLVYLSSNWVSRLGVVLVTTGTVFWFYLLPTILRGESQHPYLGILIFLALPGVFFGGLTLIPVGIVWRWRRERRKGVYPTEFPVLDFGHAGLRQLAVFVGVTTVVNVLIGGQLAYNAVSYMDGVTFCGQTCHTVMTPEYTAYRNSPHARVECVQCHIGPGASWFVRSKLAGAGQVLAVSFNTFPRPIPTPVHNLRPARETCEACHWPQKFEGDRLLIIPEYAEDETNTLSKTVLLMHIGGGNGGPGIHGAHLGPGIVVRYVADESRQNITWVEYSNQVAHRTAVYVAPDTVPATVNRAAARVMDCMDCHNRPTHIFQLPEEAMDQAMAEGKISPALPYVKKEGIELLKQDYATQDEAARRITASLASFYQKDYPAIYSAKEAEIAQTGQALVGIYRQNVFPEMRLKWGTYPNDLGHKEFPGCYRCHGKLASAENQRKIPKHCDTCHNLLATDEPNPKVLDELGLSAGGE